MGTLMSTMPAIRSAEQLARQPRDGFRYELVRGELRRTVAAGADHGWRAMLVAAPLHRFVQERGLGRVFAAETGFELARDHVRAPDVAFVRQERIDEVGECTGFWPGAPDVAVEVVSPNDRYTEVEEKVFDWLDNGASVVVVVNTRRRSVSVFRSRRAIEVLGKADELVLDDVVAGFRLPVAEVFA